MGEAFITRRGKEPGEIKVAFVEPTHLYNGGSGYAFQLSWSGLDTTNKKYYIKIFFTAASSTSGWYEFVVEKGVATVTQGNDLASYIKTFTVTATTIELTGTYGTVTVEDNDARCVAVWTE